MAIIRIIFGIELLLCHQVAVVLQLKLLLATIDILFRLRVVQLHLLVTCSLAGLGRRAIILVIILLGG